MPVSPETACHGPGSGWVHLIMLGTDPERQPDRHPETGTPVAPPGDGYGARTTPIRTAASVQRRSHGEAAAVPSRIRPRNPRAARRRIRA